MAEQKLRRKHFLVTAGATVLGWIGIRAGNIRQEQQVLDYNAGTGNRLRQDPRAVPCSRQTY